MALLVSKSSTNSNGPLNKLGNREKGEDSTFSHSHQVFLTVTLIQFLRVFGQE